MTLKQLGAISKLREEFNSIPRDNLIKGIRERESYLNKLNERELQMKREEDLER